MTKDKALKLALEALNDLSAWNDGEVGGHMDEPYSAEVARRTIISIKEALAQEQEPLAWISTGPARMIHWTADKPAYGDDWVPLYTTPPQRTWVELTEDDRVLIKHDANFNQFMTAGEYADRVQQLTEARLKDLNT